MPVGASVSTARLWVIAGALLACSGTAWGEGPALIDSLLRANPVCAPVLADAERHELQVLYTQIDRGADGRPRFTRHRYRVDPDAYFYPASAIKLAGALLALEKLNRLGLSRDEAVRIDSAYSRQTPALEDSTAPGGRPTIAHYIRKLFAVSDNDAYNRLYEFVGQQHMNEGLWEKGYEDLRLTHRLAVARSSAENRRTNPFTFYRGDEVLYRQPMLVNPHSWRARLRSPRGRDTSAAASWSRHPRTSPDRTTCRWRCCRTCCWPPSSPRPCPPTGGLA